MSSTTETEMRRCALCWIQLAAVAPPWAPQGSRFGLCVNCADARPNTALDYLRRALEAEAKGPYIVRLPLPRSYGIDALPAGYARRTA